MTALTISLCRRKPVIEAHPSLADAKTHTASLQAALFGLVPMSILGPNGEWVYVHSPALILADGIIHTALRDGRSRVGVPAVRHFRDEDCTINPKTQCCTQCGVDHSTACLKCYGRGFHRLGCPEVES